MSENKRIQVTRSSMPSLEEYVDEIRDIWESHWLTNMGKKHQRLEEELRSFLSVDHVELVSNGHMALEMALQAMNLPRGGEVITTPFTFASTTHAIVRNGLTPVFADIDPDSYCMDTSCLEDLVNDKTCAILPVHVYGNICDTDEIERIADKYELKVIYDAAHAFGVTYRGRGIGSYGDVSCFSFHATKVFNTIEGGAVCYHEEALGKEIYRLKNFGIRDEETVDGIGANAKMNEFCAAMGLCNLKHLKEEIEKRKERVLRYWERLGNTEGLRLSCPGGDVDPNYAYFPIQIREKEFGATRNEVHEALASEGIGARKYFYPLTNDFECYRDRFDASLTPIALGISKRVLTLPLYADLPLDDVDRICDVVLRCKK